MAQKGLHHVFGTCVCGTYLQLQSFVVIIVDNEADTSILFVCDSERHHTDHLHVL